MPEIVGIAGSLRRGSVNAALLRAAAEVAPGDWGIEIVSIRDVPLYDGDVEKQGMPPAVTALMDRVAGAAGLLLATPEYNGSMPGVLKNTIDWLSRPAPGGGKVLGDKPVAMIGATPGTTGTRLAQTAWLGVFRNLGMRPWFGMTMYVAGAYGLFDDQGRLTDDETRERLTRFMAGFAAFAGR